MKSVISAAVRAGVWSFFEQESIAGSRTQVRRKIFKYPALVRIADFVFTKINHNSGIAPGLCSRGKAVPLRRNFGSFLLEGFSRRIPSHPGIIIWMETGIPVHGFQ